MRTYSPKASEIERAWHVIDAEGLVLGRLCTEAARILRGKHKPIFAPHIDTGDHVIIVNAAKVVLTVGQGRRQGASTATPATRAASSARPTPTCWPASPTTRCASSVRGMLPKGPLGPPDAQEAEGLRRPRRTRTPPSSRSRSSWPTPRPAEERDEPMTKPLIQTTGRRKEPSPACACVRAPAVITVNRRPIENYFPTPTHRMVVTEPLRLTSTEEIYDIDATHRRRRRHRPGRRAAPGHRPCPHRARPRDAARPEEGRPPHP